MTTFEAASMAALGLFGLALVWHAICNEMTYQARITIIKAIRGTDLYLDYEKVSYGRHLHTLATFRNPYSLYSTAILLRLASYLGKPTTNTQEASS